jgi:hypothetical protein
METPGGIMIQAGDLEQTPSTSTIVDEGFHLRCCFLGLENPPDAINTAKLIAQYCCQASEQTG